MDNGKVQEGRKESDDNTSNSIIPNGTFRDNFCTEHPIFPNTAIIDQHLGISTLVAGSTGWQAFRQ